MFVFETFMMLGVVYVADRVPSVSGKFKVILHTCIYIMILFSFLTHNREYWNPVSSVCRRSE